MNIQDIHFFVKSNKIEARIYLPDEIKSMPSQAGVLFCTGRISSQEGYVSRATSLAKHGFVVMTWSYSGCGNSDGTLSDQGIGQSLEEAIVAFDVLAGQKSVDPARIGICGRSYGGYLAAFLTQYRKVASIVLSAPAIYFEDWHNIRFDEIPQSGWVDLLHNTPYDDAGVINATKAYQGSVLVIENEKDECVPSKMVKPYFDFAVKSKFRHFELLKDAGHELTGDYNTIFENMIADWFLKTL